MFDLFIQHSIFKINLYCSICQNFVPFKLTISHCIDLEFFPLFEVLLFAFQLPAFNYDVKIHEVLALRCSMLSHHLQHYEPMLEGWSEPWLLYFQPRCLLTSLKKQPNSSPSIWAASTHEEDSDSKRLESSSSSISLSFSFTLPLCIIFCYIYIINKITSEEKENSVQIIPEISNLYLLNCMLF